MLTPTSGFSFQQPQIKRVRFLSTLVRTLGLITEMHLVRYCVMWLRCLVFPSLIAVLNEVTNFLNWVDGN